MASCSRTSKDQIYDEVRKKWVAKTPEEEVRQSLLRKMIHELLYPKGLLFVEKTLSDLLPQILLPYRRVDVVCFWKTKGMLRPLLAIECKEDQSLLEEALLQVQGYNHFLKARFVAVVAPGQERFGVYGQGGMHFLPYLPNYADLVRWMQHAL